MTKVSTSLLVLGAYLTRSSLKKVKTAPNLVSKVSASEDMLSKMKKHDDMVNGVLMKWEEKREEKLSGVLECRDCLIRTKSMTTILTRLIMRYLIV